MRAQYLDVSGPMRGLHSASMLMYGMSSSARVIVHQDDLSPERAAEGKLKDVLTEVSFVLLPYLLFPEIQKKKGHICHSKLHGSQ